MAFPNTEYPRSFANEALPGQIGDNGPHRIEAHRNASGADVPAGIFVTRGAADEEFDTIDADSDPVLGVTLLSMATNPRELADPANAIEDGATANVMVEGPVWVKCEEAMALTSAVYIRHASGGGGSQLGAVRNDSDTNTARLCKGARVIRASAGGQVLLQISGLVDQATL